MKTIFAILIAVLGLSIPSVAQSGGKTSGKAAKGITTAEVKVYGNCGMCERRIEDDVRAKDEVYDKLHGCCKYERPAPMKVN